MSGIPAACAMPATASMSTTTPPRSARVSTRTAPPSLEGGDALLERRNGRVGQARIDVAEGRQVEQRGRVVDVVEDIGGRVIDRHDAGAGGRVGRRPGVARPR